MHQCVRIFYLAIVNIYIEITCNRRFWLRRSIFCDHPTGIPLVRFSVVHMSNRNICRSWCRKIHIVINGGCHSSSVSLRQNFSSCKTCSTHNGCGVCCPQSGNNVHAHSTTNTGRRSSSKFTLHGCDNGNCHFMLYNKYIESYIRRIQTILD